MRPRVYWSLLLFQFGLCLWLGSLLFFGATTGVLFALLSRDSAGRVVAELLGRLHLFELAGAVLIVLSLWLLWGIYRSWQLKLSAAALVVMLTLFALYAALLEPMMNSLARQVSSFEQPQPHELDAIAQFRGYHRLHTLLTAFNGLLLLGLLLWQSLLYVRVLGNPEPTAASSSGAAERTE
jgi:hypothetical protein